jgi:hypothetical protein
MMPFRRLLAGVVTVAVLVGTADRLPTNIASASHPYYSYPCPTVSGGRDFNGNGFEEEGWGWNPLNGSWISGPLWGMFGDVPAPADYTGDGVADRTVWRPSTGAWLVQCSSTSNCPGGVISLTWGTAGDIPVPGDYNNDGFGDFAVWRPSTGVWYVLAGPSGGSVIASTSWGVYGDCPVPGRLFGSGAGPLELNVFRPSTGVWFYGRTLAGTGGTSATYGIYGDLPFSIDVDGDLDGEIVVWRPSTGDWHIRTPSAVVSWGVSGDIPTFRSDPGAPANLSVWRPSTQRLYTCNDPLTGCTSTGTTIAVTPADRVPVSGRYR